MARDAYGGWWPDDPNTQDAYGGNWPNQEESYEEKERRIEEKRREEQDAINARSEAQTYNAQPALTSYSSGGRGGYSYHSSSDNKFTLGGFLAGSLSLSAIILFFKLAFFGAAFSVSAVGGSILIGGVICAGLWAIVGALWLVGKLFEGVSWLVRKLIPWLLGGFCLWVVFKVIM